MLGKWTIFSLGMSGNYRNAWMYVQDDDLEAWFKKC